jgi:heme-degrading monooxygenase HmoA
MDHYSDKNREKAEPRTQTGFVAINFIHCWEEYRPRFEELFSTRAHAIDQMPGFISMLVLKPTQPGEYLIISQWDNEESFRNWSKSDEFLDGHRRGFADIRAAKERGEPSPMTSEFRTYQVIAR